MGDRRWRGVMLGRAKVRDGKTIQESGRKKERKEEEEV
jgi:hypothetical protein